MNTPNNSNSPPGESTPPLILKENQRCDTPGESTSPLILELDQRCGRGNHTLDDYRNKLQATLGNSSNKTQVIHEIKAALQNISNKTQVIHEIEEFLGNSGIHVQDCIMIFMSLLAGQDLSENEKEKLKSVLGDKHFMKKFDSSLCSLTEETKKIICLSYALLRREHIDARFAKRRKEIENG